MEYNFNFNMKKESEAEQVESESRDKLSPSQAELWDKLGDVVDAANYAIDNAPFLPGYLSPDSYDRLKSDRVVPTTDRTAAIVAAEQNLDEDELFAFLQDKTTLDVGAGKSDLSKEAASRGIDAKIIAVDMKLEALLEQSGDAVQASGENLPFADNSFDNVLATYSMPFWSNSADKAVHFLDETVRVVKPGGEIRIAPIASAQERPAIDSTTGRVFNPRGGEYNQNFIQIKCEIDIAVVEWLRRAEADPNLTVFLEYNPERVDGKEVVVTSVLIRKNK